MIGCQLLFGKRAGIVLLHSGIILLLISEFVTGTTAVEGRMRINAGESVNFVEHMNSAELVFIDRSDRIKKRQRFAAKKSIEFSVHLL